MKNDVEEEKVRNVNRVYSINLGILLVPIKNNVHLFHFQDSDAVKMPMRDILNHNQTPCILRLLLSRRSL
jgi:hypothetical protein